MSEDGPQKRKYFGKVFYKTPGGYWANGMPIHAHKWVWICHHGMPDKGMDIHHKDGDKDNNEIENLELLSRSDHLKKHWQNHRELEKRLAQLEKARPLTWLKSEEGRKAVSEQGKTIWKNRLHKEIICRGCGTKKEFRRWARFCTKACYMRWRWKNREILNK